MILRAGEIQGREVFSRAKTGCVPLDAFMDSGTGTENNLPNGFNDSLQRRLQFEQKRLDRFVS